MVGTADVRYEDQGQLKSQYTTYAGAWAGALKTHKELLQKFLLQKKSKPISMNNLTKDGHLMSSLSIFKGKTVRALINVLIEATVFDVMYPRYLTILTK